MALGGTPQGTRLGKEQEMLPTQVGGQWPAESPQAPAGHQGKEAHSCPQALPCCLLSALSSAGRSPGPRAGR